MKVTVASGEGETGKTFVSTNLFHTFKSMDISVSLADCDAEVPNSLALLLPQRIKKGCSSIPSGNRYVKMCILR